MIKKPITIQLANGLEARPVALLVHVASQFESEIQIERGKRKVNAKSIMGMMSVTLSGGEQLTVVTDGEDEKKAAQDIKTFFDAV